MITYLPFAFQVGASPCHFKPARLLHRVRPVNAACPLLFSPSLLHMHPPLNFTNLFKIESFPILTFRFSTLCVTPSLVKLTFLFSSRGVTLSLSAGAASTPDVSWSLCSTLSLSPPLHNLNPFTFSYIIDHKHTFRFSSRGVTRSLSAGAASTPGVSCSRCIARSRSNDVA